MQAINLALGLTELMHQCFHLRDLFIYLSGGDLDRHRSCILFEKVISLSNLSMRVFVCRTVLWRNGMPLCSVILINNPQQKKSGVQFSSSAK